MAYVITSLCERCGSCEQVCPTDAIHHVDDDADWLTYYIHPESCIECAACEAECEAQAIFHQDDLPAEHTADIQANVDFYDAGPGKDLI